MYASGSDQHDVSQELFRAAFDHAAIGMAFVGSEGRWLRVNAAFCAITGYTESELLRLTFQEITHPDDLETDIAFSALLSRGEIPAYRTDKRYVRKDGGSVWVRVNSSLVRDTAGTAVFGFAQVEDISDRKRTELALQANEERYRLALEAAGLGVYGWDPAADRTDADDRVRAIVGLNPGTEFSLAAALDRYIHPDDRDRYVAAASALIDPAGDGHLSEEIRWIGSDGRERWLAVLGQAYFGVEDGKRSVRVVGVLRDVTEAKRAEAALRTSETRYRLLVEQLPAVVYLLANDAIQTPIYMSPKAEPILGQSVAAILSRKGSWLERVHPDDRDRVADWNEVWPDERELFDARYRMLKADGSAVWVWDICVPLRDEAGAVVAWQGILFDVSAEQELQQELVAAKEAAEASNRLKSAFLSTMSHELRTPLGAIIGYAGLLLDDATRPLDPGQRADLEQIATSADRLLHLINDVLDLSRIEAGGVDLVSQSVDVARSLADAREELAALAEVKGIFITAEAPPGLPSVRADPDRVHQILVNLVGNAVKFTEHGSVTVSARQTGETVEIAVRDTGIGIAPDVLPHIFDEFRQGDESTTRQYGGSGLGLAIARRLAELHGGTIDVESTLGAGSTFTLVLPHGA